MEVRNEYYGGIEEGRLKELGHVTRIVTEYRIYWIVKLMVRGKGENLGKSGSVGCKNEHGQWRVG